MVHPRIPLSNALVKSYGIARFYLVSDEPFGLLHVGDQPRPPSSRAADLGAAPASRDLALRFGLYKTLGWSMDTWALNELRIDEKTFLEDVYFSENKFAEIMRGLLDDGDFDLYVHVFELTDRVSHVFWRFQDPEYPGYDSTMALRYGGAIRDSYAAMDSIVGDAEDRLNPEDVLLICSDHGFHPWHKTAHYNTWLVQNGYMTLKSDTPDSDTKPEDLFGKGQFWPNVDWAETKAYALGLGDIYLNVKGREGQGIVEPGEEYDRIRSRLAADLEAWIDPENGEHPVRRAIKREDVYRDFDPDLIPDLSASPKYRVSWQTSLGGIPGPARSERPEMGATISPARYEGILLSTGASGPKRHHLDLFPPCSPSGRAAHRISTDTCFRRPRSRRASGSRPPRHIATPRRGR
jgi:hypothetical protein